jgi:hypothetical protein
MVTYKLMQSTDKKTYTWSGPIIQPPDFDYDKTKWIIHTWKGIYMIENTPNTAKSEDPHWILRGDPYPLLFWALAFHVNKTGVFRFSVSHVYNPVKKDWIFRPHEMDFDIFVHTFHDDIIQDILKRPHQPDYKAYVEGRVEVENMFVDLKECLLVKK